MIEELEELLDDLTTVDQVEHLAYNMLRLASSEEEAIFWRAWRHAALRRWQTLFAQIKPFRRQLCWDGQAQCYYLKGGIQ